MALAAPHFITFLHPYPIHPACISHLTIDLKWEARLHRGLGPPIMLARRVPGVILDRRCVFVAILIFLSCGVLAFTQFHSSPQFPIPHHFQWLRPADKGRSEQVMSSRDRPNGIHPHPPLHSKYRIHRSVLISQLGMVRLNLREGTRSKGLHTTDMAQRHTGRIFPFRVIAHCQTR